MIDLPQPTIDRFMENALIGLGFKVQAYFQVDPRGAGLVSRPLNYRPAFQGGGFFFA